MPILKPLSLPKPFLRLLRYPKFHLFPPKALHRRLASDFTGTPKPALPERLLIYHAGTGRTVFIGCWKVTTFFLLAFSCLVVAPSQYNIPESPPWMPYAVVVGGAIPLLVIAYTTAPFVTYIHLRLPLYARRSKDNLMRWAEKIPQSTELDVTLIGFFGWPRVYRMHIGELRRTKLWLSPANIKRVVGPSMDLHRKRPWWRGKLPTLFYVGEDRARTLPVWSKLLEQLKDD